MLSRMPEMNPADPIRLRLRDTLHARKISQQKLCELLTERTGETWHIQRMSKLMNGRLNLRVEDLVLICKAAGISLVEIVREPGREFVSDVTPSELRLLEAIRDHPQLVPAILQLLGPSNRKPSRQTIKQRMARDSD